MTRSALKAIAIAGGSITAGCFCLLVGEPDPSRTVGIIGCVALLVTLTAGLCYAWMPRPTMSASEIGPGRYPYN